MFLIVVFAIKNKIDWIEQILLSARYEIRAASSEDYVFVPPNLFDVTAP